MSQAVFREKSVSLLLMLFSIFLLLPSAGAAQKHKELILATTTSTYDSGLLGELNPLFEERFDTQIKVIAVGTGAAIRHAQDGDVDVILVHARGAEDTFLKEGWGVNRRDVMYNDFVILGPQDDPAGIEDTNEATVALARIAEQKTKFVSRADNSGTHKKELSIWENAGIETGGNWYLQVGKGMGDTIVQADTMGAYTLSDRGTYLSMKDKIDLEILLQGPVKGGDETLMNSYGIIAVNPAKYPSVNYSRAMAYIGFLTSVEGQKIIENYKVNGEQLFFPHALEETPNFAQYVPEGYCE